MFPASVLSVYKYTNVSDSAGMQQMNPLFCKSQHRTGCANIKKDTQESLQQTWLQVSLETFTGVRASWLVPMPKPRTPF